MCRPNIYILFLFVGFVNVNSMALKGPALTRYDPCGLGAIHFDKIGEQYWGGVIHSGFYSSLDEVQTDIYFEKPVKIFYKERNNNSVFNRTTSWNTHFMVKQIAPFRSEYDFKVLVANGYETDVPIVTKFLMNNVTLCSNDIKASQTIKSLNVTSSSYGNRYAHVCGRKSLHRTELVSVRTEASAGDWPWHVALLIRRRNTNETKYRCGGNIISRTAVLTAGHCIYIRGKLLEADEVNVIAGTNNYKDLYQAGRQVLFANELILHPSYSDKYSTSDLGIIKVNSFVYTEFVQPICVWGPAYDKTTLFDKEATMVGFGTKEDNKESEVLRSAYLKIQNDSTCVAFSPKVYKPLMNEFTFCAGYGPTSVINPRNGDSGGGLVLSTIQPDHRISWFLRGIFSKCGISPGHLTCDPTYYVVYTDVGPHYGWISHHSGLQFRVNVA